jgi:hypothetical protein
MVRRTLATVAALAILVIALPAVAFDCTQSDGELGWLNGTTGDDAGCITESEYAELYSVDGLVDAGALSDVIDNGDGTVTGIDWLTGVAVTIISSPLDRPVAANTNPASPAFEADAPTVREVLFPATAYRLAAMVG